MKTKTFNKYLELTDQTLWSEKDIKYFRKAINTDCTPEQRELLLDAIVNKSYSLTWEQQQKGTEYLLRKSLKLNGQPRKGCKLGEFELSVLNNNCKHELVDLYNIHPFMGTQYVPVYRAFDADGNWFEYLGVTYDMLQVIRLGQGHIAA